MSTVDIQHLGECAWLLRFGDTIEPGSNQRVHAFCRWLKREDPEWLGEVVPAYAAVSVQLHPRHELADGIHRRAEQWLRGAVERFDPVDAHAPGRRVEVPVCYGGRFGPDLEEAARMLDITPSALIERHSAEHYDVAMIGFAAGFPYLLGLPQALALPRLDRPRTQVPAGSIGIGGAQTGIYPEDGPGGWRLIGRTPLKLFSPAADPPCLLQPGDCVRFIPIDAERFVQLAVIGGPAA